MKNLILIILGSFLVLSLFSDCKRNPAANTDAATQAAIDSFALTYEEGLDTCTVILMKNLGLDSVTARKRCICMYNTYTERDSTFTRMNPADRQTYMTAHRDEVIRKCDSLIPAKQAKFKE